MKEKQFGIQKKREENQSQENIAKKSQGKHAMSLKRSSAQCTGLEKFRRVSQVEVGASGGILDYLKNTTYGKLHEKHFTPLSENLKKINHRFIDYQTNGGKRQFINFWGKRYMIN